MVFERKKKEEKGSRISYVGCVEWFAVVCWGLLWLKCLVKMSDKLYCVAESPNQLLSLAPGGTWAN